MQSQVIHMDNAASYTYSSGWLNEYYQVLKDQPAPYDHKPEQTGSNYFWLLAVVNNKLPFHQSLPYIAKTTGSVTKTFASTTCR